MSDLSPRPDLLTADPNLIAFLPLMYVAWADGVLTPSEMARISAFLDEQPWLTQAERDRVTAWLDPQHPPTATQYRQWLRALRTAAAEVPAADRQSLAELSILIAAQTGGDGEARFTAEPAREAFHDIEAALGLIGEEVTTILLTPRPAPPTLDDTPLLPFDLAALTHQLDQPFPALRAKIRTLLQDPVFQYEALPDDAYRQWVFERCRLLAEQGLGGLAYPEAYGGADDMEQFITAFEMLAYHDLSVVIKYGVQFGLFGGSILRLGTARHHAQYLPAVGRLDLSGCFAMTEKGHGSNVRELETTARYDPDTETFVVHTPHHDAHKEYIGNAAVHGRLATVFAQLETLGEGYGVHAFLVPIRDEHGQPLANVRIEDSGHKLGLNGVDNGRIWFDAVRIPRENLLDRFAQVAPDGTYTSQILSEGRRFFTMLGTLVGGRISVAKAGLSAAKSGLTIAIRYGQRRRQFGPPGQPEVRLLDYRTHQRRLLPPLATAYALHFALTDLANRFARRRVGEAMLDVETMASALKAYTTWFNTETLQTAREACGGQGYLAINRFAALKADTDVFTTFEGDNTVLMLQVAKSLLSRYKDSFHDLTFFGLVRQLATDATGTLRERNPVMARRTDTDHLRAPDVHRALFTDREHDLLISVARRLKHRIDAGMNSYDAFIDVQDHLVSLAQAYAERHTLDRFLDAIEATEAPDQRAILRKLATLFALSRLEHDAAWFLSHGYFEPAKAKAIRDEVNALCTEIRPYAVALVDAFAIPDACLAAPIAV